MGVYVTIFVLRLMEETLLTELVFGFPSAAHGKKHIESKQT